MQDPGPRASRWFPDAGAAARPGAQLGAGRGRAALLAGAGLAVSLYVAGLWTLDISLPRIVHGLGQLGTVVRLMLPPDDGGHVLLYLDALAACRSEVASVFACLGQSCVAGWR